MQVAYELTERDLRAFFDHLVEEQGMLRAFNRRVLLLFPIVTALVGWLAFEWIGALFGLAVGALVAILVIPQTMKATFSKRFDQMLAAAPDGLMGPHTLELTDDAELVATTSASSCRWVRSAVRSVVTTDEHAFIKFGPENALILPLRPDPAGDRRRIVESLSSGPPVIIPPPPPQTG